MIGAGQTKNEKDGWPSSAHEQEGRCRCAPLLVVARAPRPSQRQQRGPIQFLQRLRLPRRFGWCHAGPVRFAIDLRSPDNLHPDRRHEHVARNRRIQPRRESRVAEQRRCQHTSGLQRSPSHARLLARNEHLDDGLDGPRLGFRERVVQTRRPFRQRQRRDQR